MAERLQFPLQWSYPELRIGKRTVVGSGVLSITERGRIELQVTGKGVRQLGDREVTLAGATDAGDILRATMCSVRRTDGHRATLVVGGADIKAPARKVRWTQFRAHLRGVQCHGPTRFRDAAYAIELRDRGHREGEPKGNIRATLTVTPDAPMRRWGDDLAQDYLQVLSVAQRVHVWAAVEQFFDGDALVRTKLHNISGGWECTHPLIPWWPKPLASFFDQALPRYRAARSGYELDTLIWYYCRAYIDQVVEMKFIAGSVFMEAFKFHWAKNVARLTPDLKANGLVRGFVRTTNKKGDPVLFNFEELLTQACAQLGFTPDVSFIEDRNALFHTGAPGAAQRGQTNSWLALQRDLARLYDQMDEVLLRIFGYRGPIHTWAAANRTLRFPKRTRVRKYDPFA